MVEFNSVQSKYDLTTKLVEVESATVIPPRTLVGNTGGYPVKATASHDKVAYAINGSKAGETSMVISVGNEFILKGTADVNFARATHAYSDCDIVDNAGTLNIDLDSHTTNVLSIVKGTEGSNLEVEFKINKPLI